MQVVYILPRAGPDLERNLNTLTLNRSNGNVEPWGPNPVGVTLQRPGRSVTRCAMLGPPSWDRPGHLFTAHLVPTPLQPGWPFRVSTSANRRHVPA